MTGVHGKLDVCCACKQRWETERAIALMAEGTFFLLAAGKVKKAGSGRKEKAGAPAHAPSHAKAPTPALAPGPARGAAVKRAAGVKGAHHDWFAVLLKA